MGVAVNGQEIEIELGKATHGGLNGGPDVEELHIEENALAALFFQLVRQRQTAARQHAKADLVERHGIAKLVGKLEPLKRVRHVQGHDQAVICTHGAGLSWVTGAVKRV